MKNKVYYKIAEKNGKLQYHVSSVRTEVAELKSMSKSISLNSPKVEELRKAWEQEAEDCKLIKA